MTLVARPTPSGTPPSAGDAAVLRVLGEAAAVLSVEAFEVSAQVEAVRRTVDASDHGFEDHGRLVFLPVGAVLPASNPNSDAQAGLQLHYLQRSDAGRAVVTSLYFHPDFLAQWPAKDVWGAPAFRRDLSTEHQVALCTATEALLEELFAPAPSAPGFGWMLRRSEVATALLRRAVDAVAVPFEACPVPACRFLAHESEREKIFAARALLEATTDRMVTIKELARKVAINECYLKKGFKALTGQTVYDFQHARRIQRAQHLLADEGRSVTEVSEELGFSSISHFSTAFKKATGIKPCELLK